MKFVCILFGLIAFASRVSAQEATVIHVKGVVTYKGKPLAVADKVAESDALSSKDIHAEVGLLDPVHGRMLFTFGHGKAAGQSRQKSENEIYTLTIKTFLQDYTATKALTHKGVFDFKAFFTDTTLENPIRIVLIAGQGVPFTSAGFHIQPGNIFSLCADTSCKVLKRTDDSLYFTGKPGLYRLKFGYQYQGSFHEHFLPGSVRLSFISPRQVRELVAAFRSVYISYYHNDAAAMAGDIYAELDYLYGNCYQDGVDRYIPELQ